MECHQNRQRGVVILSVLSVLGLMSLMIAHSARQTLWLSQTAQHVAEQQAARAYRRTVVAALYRFDLSRVSDGSIGSACHGVDDRSCLCVAADTSAANTWRFQLWSVDNPNQALLSGWLRGSPAPYHQVIAVSLGQPAGSCRTAISTT